MQKVVCPYCGRVAKYVDSSVIYYGHSYGMCFAKNTQTAKQPCGGGATTGEANRTSRSKQKLHPEAG